MGTGTFALPPLCAALLQVTKYRTRVDESYALGVKKAVAYGVFAGGEAGIGLEVGLRSVRAGHVLTVLVRDSGMAVWMCGVRCSLVCVCWALCVWAGIGAVAYMAMLMVLW